MFSRENNVQYACQMHVDSCLALDYIIVIIKELVRKSHKIAMRKSEHEKDCFTGKSEQPVRYYDYYNLRHFTKVFVHVFYLKVWSRAHIMAWRFRSFITIKCLK